MPDPIKNPKNKVIFQWVLLVLITGILAVSLYFFVGNFENLRLHGYIRAHIRRQIIGQKITSEQIRGWMTFRYVNLMFGLPPAYLQNTLGVKDGHYPNVSLDVLAKEQNLSSAQIVAKTSEAVKNFVSKPNP